MVSETIRPFLAEKLVYSQRPDTDACLGELSLPLPFYELGPGPFMSLGISYFLKILSRPLMYEFRLSHNGMSRSLPVYLVRTTTN